MIAKLNCNLTLTESNGITHIEGPTSAKGTAQEIGDMLEVLFKALLEGGVPASQILGSLVNVVGGGGIHERQV